MTCFDPLPLPSPPAGTSFLSNCVPCPINFITPHPGTATCTACPVGEYTCTFGSNYCTNRCGAEGYDQSLFRVAGRESQAMVAVFTESTKVWSSSCTLTLIR